MRATGGAGRDVITARLRSASSTSIEVEVDGPGGARTLAYRSEKPAWSQAPATLDFAAVALAQHAAAHGADLRIDGSVTAAQLDRLDEFVQIWAGWRPDLFKRVGITATEEVAEPEPPGRPVALMGFSGGVDGCFALAAHHTGAVGRLSQQIALGVLVIGWDIRHGDDNAVQKATAAAGRQLAAYDADLVVVETNWKDEFSPAWFMCFNAGLTGILHTFSGTHGVAVHATDHNYRAELNMPPYGSNMAINHLLGRPGFPLLSTGGTHRRIERVRFLADHPVLVENLRVCYQDDAAGLNCGRCEKCVRTQLELIALGMPTEVAFPHQMTPEDLENATVTNATVLQHFQDIHDQLPEDHEYFGRVGTWVRRERMAIARQLNGPLAKIADLEAELGQVKAELTAARQRLDELDRSAAQPR